MYGLTFLLFSPFSEVKKVKGPKRVIDTGAGFLIDEEDEEEVKTLTQEPKVVHAPGRYV